MLMIKQFKEQKKKCFPTHITSQEILASTVSKPWQKYHIIIYSVPVFIAPSYATVSQEPYI